MKRKRQLDRQEQDRTIDRLIKELEDLKRHGRDAIKETQAEKTFREGLYYRRIGKIASAQFYFDKVLQRWPASPRAVQAKEQRVHADPKPDDRTDEPS